MIELKTSLKGKNTVFFARKEKRGGFWSLKMSANKRDRDGFAMPTMPAKKMRVQNDNDDGDDDRDDKAKVGIQQIVDSAPEMPALDESGLKRALAALEKRLATNAQLRADHAGQPEKFMESELALDDEIRRLGVLATAPHLYGALARSGAAEHLIALLAHENSDIALEAVHLLDEMSDAEVIVGPSQESAMTFIESLIEHQLIETLVSNLFRLKEAEATPEDAQGIFETLEIFENLIELDQSYADVILRRAPKLLPWLLTRVLPPVGADDADDPAVATLQRNRLQASEVLSVLLQEVGEEVSAVQAPTTLESVLTALASFRKERVGASVEEGEIVGNLFNSLCLLLLRGGARARAMLRRFDGIQLLLILCRSVDEKDNAERTILVLAALLTSLTQKSNNNNDDDDVDIDSNALDAEALKRNTVADDQVAACAERVVAKLRENDKLMRLLALRQGILARLSIVERRIAIAVRAKEINNEEVTEEQIDEYYEQRVDAGLSTLQQCDVVLAIASNISEDFKHELIAALNRSGVSLQSLYDILIQYADTLLEDVNDDAAADNDDDNNEKKKKKEEVVEEGEQTAAGAMRARVDRIRNLASMFATKSEPKSEQQDRSSADDVPAK